MFFLSKIWFVLVALFAAATMTVAFVAPRPADRRVEQLEGQRLDHAQYAVELTLKNDARRWIDYVAKLGRDANLVDSLDAASRGSGEPRVLHETVRERLRKLVPDRALAGVESIIAVNKTGHVVARVGDDEGEFGESMAGAEVVADALRGYMTDDVWGSSNRIRRVGAAPVYSKNQDRIVGALIVSVETGKRLAEFLQKNLGVEVAIVLRKNVLSSTLPEALLGDLPKVIEERGGDIKSHKRTRALELYMGSERMLAVAAPFAGEAAAQGAYYVLLTYRSAESDPWALLSSTTIEDLSWRRFPWLSLAFTILAIIAIGLGLQRFEVEMPLRRLRHDVRGLSHRELAKLDDRKFGGVLGSIARDINASIEHFTHGPLTMMESPKPAGGISLDPKSPMQDPKAMAINVPKAPPKPSAPPPAAIAASLFGAPKAVVPGSSTTPAPVAMPTLLGPTPPPSTAPVALAALSVSAPVSAPSPMAVPPPPTPSPLQPTPAPLPPTPLPLSPPMPRPTLSTTPTPIALTQTLMFTGAPQPVESEEDRYFREVFDQYLATRTTCGEPNTGLTLEKFRAKLISNREQLIARYGCKSASFTVYVKDGKSAIRATPVRG